MAKVMLHQPCLAPWAGFWNKLVETRTTVLLWGFPYDHAEPVRRVKIRGSWAGLAVEGHQRTKTIKEVRLRDGAVAQFIQTVEGRLLSDKSLKFPDRVRTLLDKWRAYDSPWMAEVLTEMIRDVAQVLHVDREIVVSREVSDGDISETIRDLVLKYAGAKDRVLYYSGSGGRPYLKPEKMHPVQVRFQTMHAHVQDESILDVLAREPYPLEYVRMAAVWGAT